MENEEITISRDDFCAASGYALAECFGNDGGTVLLVTGYLVRLIDVLFDDEKRTRALEVQAKAQEFNEFVDTVSGGEDVD